ncbi:hypothetical protein N3K66_006014 [Trichothecium roseum]|uniref:Uncharacterized protein n=1 Tax=Trichothecium roseum TaxID=47278 RepID=A0ACC0V0Y0_9HYPO|nr:hypothetical protein N3K66_006014 [Trichothecium roseum]
MASIFTYDPDPPRVSSPWLVPEEPRSERREGLPEPGSPAAKDGQLSDYGVTKLQAEPQNGPTEYKLHLLLRPRRAYKTMTTTDRAPTAYKNDKEESPESVSRSTTPCVSVNQLRQQQERLNHLTTQLLWRLQQSSPHHSTSAKEINMPQLLHGETGVHDCAEANEVYPGLEESRGALYEIGVSDDGTLIGLTKDEMDESLATLGRMSKSLGCSVEILRKVIVGDCEWIEPVERDASPSTAALETTRHAKLWVAEALVAPNLSLHSGIRVHATGEGELQKSDTSGSPLNGLPNKGSSSTPQMRVTFTGPTMSGKSSLLGTLSIGTLDNGRGKSRLSLLKHRHEVKSGVTSSLAQELIGYKEQEILNFSQKNIESWVDIHDRAENGKLVFVSDSGGHPRYRRTVLRGLMNWAPHWSILCISGNDSMSSSAQPLPASAPRDRAGSDTSLLDLNHAHLTLLLKLKVPMAVVITKIDLASRSSVQSTMAKVLTTVKAAGRVPKIIQPDQVQHEELLHIPEGDQSKVRAVVDSLMQGEDMYQHVPIILTSAVKGTGIGLLHALLASLPMPPMPTSRDFVGMALNPEQPKSLYHVDDTFNLLASSACVMGNIDGNSGRGIVLSGYSRFGDISVGDKVVVGPYRPVDEASRGSDSEDKGISGNYGLSISHPSSAELFKIAIRNAVSASATTGEWHTAHVVSIRTLRLPVRTLESGQAGSIGLIFGSDRHARDIRRGMVVAIPQSHMQDASLSLQAATAITATFTDPDARSLTVGSLVNVYVASVRATARIRQISHHSANDAGAEISTCDIVDIFGLANGDEGVGVNALETFTTKTEVFLELFQNREWVELGSRVVILEGGRQDQSGLEAVVGKVIEIID